MPITVNFPTLSPDAVPVLAWAAAALLAWLWLRRELTPKAVLSIFETDGVLSARQILAWVVALFGLSMRAANRLDNAGLEACLEWAAFLFGIGGVVKAASKIKPASTEINAKTAKVSAEGDINFKPAQPE